MSKAVLFSIKPKYCELIANGKKTVEVRKTRPKLETPFKVYIYCTKGEYLWKDKERVFLDGKYNRIIDNMPECLLNGKVIGEFVCNSIEEFQAEFTDLKYFDSQNENVCQNTIKRVAWLEDEYEPYYFYETSNEEDNPNDCTLLRHSCLTFDELRQYIGETFFDKSFYGLHISNLVIYDQPRELSNFRKPCIYGEESDVSCFLCDKSGYRPDMHIDCFNEVTRPPQSWYYVEELI